MSLQDMKSMTLDEIKTDFAADGQPAFRALQIFKWLHRGVMSFDEMSDQSKAFRQKLSKKYYIANAVVEKKLESKVDGTIKYLFRLNDGEYVEGVLMEYHHGHTICISTQVGCKMNCAFCATGKSGFSRDLTASEMLAQIQTAQNDIGIRISNVVMMGMGEPLDNYDNVLRFLELVTCDDGINIGMRHISLSTCGIVDKIYDLAELKLQVTLSISLHAPNDEIRSKTMPVNLKWGVDELLKACGYYARLTGRRISFEYAMIHGVNDSDDCAKELADRLKGTLSHVNLIPVNDVSGADFQKSSIDRLQKFSRILSDKGITVTVRRTLGSDINASCGQLRRRYKEEVADVETIQQK